MKLSAARKAHKWTQRQLSTRAEVTQQEISRIESGRVRKPSHQSVMRLCRALGIDPAQIDEFAHEGRR